MRKVWHELSSYMLAGTEEMYSKGKYGTNLVAIC